MLGVWTAVLDLWFPVFIIIYGNIFKKKTPDIDGSNGYKTARSRLSPETWEFANHYAARIGRIVGWILLVLSAAALFFLGKGEDAGGFGSGILGAQIGIVGLSVALTTEAALKKNFDENGSRK